MLSLCSRECLDHGVGVLRFGPSTLIQFFRFSVQHKPNNFFLLGLCQQDSCQKMYTIRQTIYQPMESEMQFFCFDYMVTVSRWLYTLKWLYIAYNKKILKLPKCTCGVWIKI